MNRYMNQNQQYDSNTRIFSGSRRNASLLSVLLAALLSVTENKVLMGVVRATVTVIVLVSFVGIIGAMDAGSLGMGAGLLIGALLLAAEYLCLRRQG